MISNIVQSVSTPDAVPTLKQLLRRNVNLVTKMWIGPINVPKPLTCYVFANFAKYNCYLFVDPAVILIDCHVVALLAWDAVILLDLVSPGSAVKVHLPGAVARVGTIVAHLHPLLAAVRGDQMGGHFC